MNNKMIAGAMLCVMFNPVFAAEVRGLVPMALSAQPKHAVADNLPAHSSVIVKAGGYGGNPHTGLLSYDGTTAGLPALTVSRYDNNYCYLENYNAHILNAQTERTIRFNCAAADPGHHYLYWDANLGTVNGGYSPENDALYAADVITNMFFNWYGMPPVMDHKGRHDPIHIYLHANTDSISVNNEDDVHEIVIGDGITLNYPLTSLSIISFMVGHIFTDQHGDMRVSYGQDAGVRYAFNCMTAMATEFYATGRNTWQVGADIRKDGKPTYDMINPTFDCHDRKPGDNCSINLLAQYNTSLSGRYSSGLFNRAFYLIAVSAGYDTRKAYDLFVQANRFHWNASMSFHKAACDVVTSASELGYAVKPVIVAFSDVGIDTRDC